METNKDGDDCLSEPGQCFANCFLGLEDKEFKDLTWIRLVPKSDEKPFINTANDVTVALEMDDPGDALTMGLPQENDHQNDWSVAMTNDDDLLGKMWEKCKVEFGVAEEMSLRLFHVKSDWLEDRRVTTCSFKHMEQLGRWNPMLKKEGGTTGTIEEDELPKGICHAHFTGDWNVSNFCSKCFHQTNRSLCAMIFHPEQPRVAPCTISTGIRFIKT